MALIDSAAAIAANAQQAPQAPWFLIGVMNALQSFPRGTTPCDGEIVLVTEMLLVTEIVRDTDLVAEVDLVMLIVLDVVLEWETDFVLDRVRVDVLVIDGDLVTEPE
jgi:hypothetical protein